MLAGPALVGVLYRLQAGKSVILHSIPSRGKGNFFFSRASRSVLWPTQLPVQWELGALSPGYSRR